jgi:hypothetical protein
MKKCITWIDDDISQMKRFATSLFPKLWKKNYKNQIIFSGDDYLYDRGTVPIQTKIIERFKIVLNDIFNFFCADHVDSTYKTPMEVRKATEELCFVPLEHVEFEFMINGKQTPEENIEKIIKEIIKTVDDRAEEDTYIGIDICLFYDLPKVTMRLFYDLFNKKNSDGKNKKYTVFLYSNYFDSINAEKEWKEYFLKVYSNFNEKDIIKFSREYLISPERDKGKELSNFFKFLDESESSGRKTSSV